MAMIKWLTQFFDALNLYNFYRAFKSDELDEVRPKTLSELQDYEKLRILGAGGFGKVYLVKNKKTGLKCAAKEQDRCEMSKREAKVLNKLQHPDVSFFKANSTILNQSYGMSSNNLAII